MTKGSSKQMRVSETQYELLGQLAKKLTVSRIEMLNNTILLAQFLVENKAVSVKATTKSGEEKEIYLPMLLRNSVDES
jgi:hypothetical protein